MKVAYSCKHSEYFEYEKAWKFQFGDWRFQQFFHHLQVELQLS